jgi:CheY-like chemotaxis protein
MQIIFLTNDLVFSSRVAGAAARAGLSVQTAASREALLELTKSADGNPLVLLDLNAPGVDPAQLVPALRAAVSPPRAIIAYGPHVREDHLAAATTAGCDDVLTRGQFNVRMDELLQKWRGSTGVVDNTRPDFRAEER